MGCCNDDQPIISQKGEKGDAGKNGWSPILALEEIDADTTVVKITGWTGGTGNQPAFTNQYIGSAGIVESSDDALNVKGITGDTGATGAAGNKGWSMVPALVADGDRYVVQIVDWQGGEGTKPSTTNQFIGAAGIVSTAAAAVDIRGPQGVQGDPGDDADIPDQTGHSGEFLTTDGTNTSWEEIIQVPAVTPSTRRVLREANDGSGPEWYTPISYYISIPMQENGIFNSTTSWVTLRNTGSTVFLKQALPSDGKIRKLFISVSISLSHTTGATDKDFAHFGIRDITNDVSLTDDVIATAFRKTPCFQYLGTFTCNGQEVGLQWKHASGQDASGFIGGHISIFEIL